MNDVSGNISTSQYLLSGPCHSVCSGHLLSATLSGLQNRHEGDLLATGCIVVNTKERC